MSVGVRRIGTAGAILLALAVFALFPVVITDPTATSIAVFTLIFMVSTTSWNIFSGYSGYLALGHAVFFGTGGYSVWASDNHAQKVRGCITISSGLGSDISKCLDMTFQ